METEQTERIREMEIRLNTARQALDRLEEALERYEEARSAMDELEAYYTGGLWMRDYEDDEAGKLPSYQELPRGVLSEDAVYDVITDRRRLRALMRSLADAEPGEDAEREDTEEGEGS